MCMEGISFSLQLILEPDSYKIGSSFHSTKANEGSLSQESHRQERCPPFVSTKELAATLPRKLAKSFTSQKTQV